MSLVAIFWNNRCGIAISEGRSIVRDKDGSFTVASENDFKVHRLAPDLVLAAAGPCDVCAEFLRSAREFVGAFHGPSDSLFPILVKYLDAKASLLRESDVRAGIALVGFDGAERRVRCVSWIDVEGYEAIEPERSPTQMDTLMLGVPEAQGFLWEYLKGREPGGVGAFAGHLDNGYFTRIISAVTDGIRFAAARDARINAQIAFETVSNPSFLPQNDRIESPPASMTDKYHLSAWRKKIMNTYEGTQSTECDWTTKAAFVITKPAGETQFKGWLTLTRTGSPIEWNMYARLKIGALYSTPVLHLEDPNTSVQAEVTVSNLASAEADITIEVQIKIDLLAGTGGGKPSLKQYDYADQDGQHA